MFPNKVLKPEIISRIVRGRLWRCVVISSSAEVARIHHSVAVQVVGRIASACLQRERIVWISSGEVAIRDLIVFVLISLASRIGHAGKEDVALLQGHGELRE